MKTAEVLIVGAGPAGLAAAITLASEGRSVILLEKASRVGGQAGTSSAIENYPPFSRGFTGAHFSDEADAQCRKFGVQIEYSTEVLALLPGCNRYTLITSNGPYHGRAVLLAMGLSNRHLGVPGEALPCVYHGMRMDALANFSGRDVVLVGGGNSVGQAALHYLEQGAQVTLVAHRGLASTMSKYLLDRVENRCRVVFGDVTAFSPVGMLVQVTVRSANRFHSETVADCVHIFIGQHPATEWLGKQVWKDTQGYILTNAKHQTSLSGVFVVGDVASDAVRRVACAVGAGSAVVPVIHRYLDSPDECQVA